MNTTIPNHHPNEHDLEAMLYVLRDPALDCVAFETRMSDDPLLAEAVSNAVSLVFDIKSQSEVQSEVSFGCQSIAKPSLAKPAASVAMPWISFDPAWVALATISAVVSLFLLSVNYSSMDESAEPMFEVAAAWTDLQSTKTELQNADLKNGTSLLSHADLDDSLLSLEPKNLDNDLPDWILLAAIASDSTNTEMVQ